MIILLLILLSEFCQAAQGPLYKHVDNVIQKEFEHNYQITPDARTTPKIFISAGAPTFTALKVGDIDISTTTGKVYIATDTVSSGGWAIMN